MYCQRFRLTKNPFHVTPDPEFLYQSPTHREALASIVYGIDERKGFIAVTGEVGVGKTTILRAYMERADREKNRIIYLFNANITFKGLIVTLCRELGVSAETEDYFDLVPRLHEALIEEYRNGRNTVLIIDEAQNMPVDTLENLRMLSNLETTRDKLLQIVLCGQIELEYMLSLRQLRQLNQRIVVRAVISPLTREESLEYIRHRLARAGCRRGIPFTKSALRRIVRHAGGIPRIINIVCDNALITAYGCRTEKVTAAMVKEVVIERKGRRRAGIPRWAYALLALILAGTLGLWLSATKMADALSVGKYISF